MNSNPFLFNIQQFSRIFPFYLEINEGLAIVSAGNSVEKLFGKTQLNQFLEAFDLEKPASGLINFNTLKQLCGQLVMLRARNTAGTMLRGQFEMSQEEGSVLFLGSPWLDSSDKFLKSNLSLSDFAARDPLIDLIPILEAHETVNEDLQNLHAKLSQQKKELKTAAREMEDMAMFSLRSPDPLFRVRTDGTVTMRNPAAEKLEAFIYEGAEYKGDSLWAKLAAKEEWLNDYYTFEAQSGNKTYSFVCRLIPHLGCSDVFGKDISIRKQREEEVKILSDIAQSNINPVILTDKKGRITWANKSFTEVTGYTLEEVIGKKPGRLLQGPASNPQTVDYLREQVKNTRPFNTEILNYNKQGRPYWVRIQSQPIFNAAGVHTGFFAIEEDITSEKNVQEQLKQFEARYRLALEKTGDNVWEHDFGTGITFFSKPVSEFLGYTADDYTDTAQLWWESVHKDDLYMLANNDAKYKSGEGDSHSMEYRVLHKNGTVKWILDRGVVIEKDADGKPARIIGTHTDITKIKQTEVELEERVKQFKSFSENIPGVIYEYEFRKDGSEGFRYISPALERVFGIKSDDFRNYAACIDAADIKKIAAQNKECRKNLSPFYTEARLNIPGNGVKWHSVQSSFSYISQNGAIVYTGVMMDITERKNSENMLRANEEKYRGIIANMKLGLLEVDNKGQITFANNSFCQMSGYAAEELLGKTADSLFTISSQAQPEQYENALLKKGSTDAYQIEIHNKKGAKKWWLVSAAPNYNDNGMPVGTIGIHLDITMEKELEAELIDARERAEHLARTKETFLANMSHEIRTPMNAITGMSHQLAKTSLTTQQQFYLQTIHTATDNLLVIINDILDLSKIEAGKLIIEHIGFEPKAMVAKAINTLAYKAEEKGIALKNSFFDENISPVLMGDPNRLNQILLNLLSNAVKFTERGSVEVFVKLGRNKAASQEIMVEVRDTGIGMDEAFLAHVFEKFSQENESVSRLYGGTGLGMSICRQLIDLMGGRISAKSKKGEGTVIAFAVELLKGTAAQLPVKQEASYDLGFFKNKKVLVVDDNRLNRIVASAVMLDYGMAVTEATDGLEALDELARQNFDVVLMDVQMPGMDGYEAAAAIRSLGNKVPIIAFTAKAIKGEQEKCLAAGMNDYVTKPFREEELMRAIARLMGANIPVLQKAAAAAQPAEEGAPLYNMAALHEFSRGNDKFVQKMIRMFCAETPTSVKTMTEAYTAGDFAKMGSIAHKIKPNIDYMGIASLKEVVREVERLGKENSDSDGLPQMLQTVEDVVNEVVVQLQKEQMQAVV